MKPPCTGVHNKDMKPTRIFLIITVNLILAILTTSCSPRSSPVIHDEDKKLITLSGYNGDLVIRLNYDNGCVVDKVSVNSNEVLSDGNIALSGIRVNDQMLSSKESSTPPRISIDKNTVNISDIKYGNQTISVGEEWIFTVNSNDIQWQINREYLTEGIIDENYFPCWQFNSMETWDGAMLDNGGVAWNRFLREPGETYGTSASALTFWNRSDNSGLRITPSDDPNTHRAATFTHKENAVHLVVQSSSLQKISTRFGLRRFLKTGQNVFNPDTVSRSHISINNKLEVFTYDREYERGVLNGINDGSLIEMLNTIGRYGVVDKYLYGSNGWRTGWAVLQEPWLALMGLAVNSPEFIRGYSETLEYQRDNAILPDGRVLPRWHHDASDAMPNTFRENGFYECMWGYMLDSQPAFAINVAEQFDITGDIEWLRQFKTVCEKVLQYITDRDSDGNGLFEVIQKTHREEQGTDWLDVIWASYEVATINAMMYKALVRWSELEKLLGDPEMSEKYEQLALKLKITFNKNIAEGGFWNPDQEWYVHWREEDGSVYGNNLVSPVNFLAIGYGLCDDPFCKDAILTNMEILMQKENLFIWPSCFFPYEEGVGLARVNYPYPNYENGDLFLAWAELGVRCYADGYPEVALKYIRNVMDRYESDGLAHQRYKRTSQTGTGSDILSNNVMAVVGLYRNLYGIQPQYNRLYINPKLTGELSGTSLKYWYQDQVYWIELNSDQYSISADSYSVSDTHPFGMKCAGNTLEYFNREESSASLKITSAHSVSIDILTWDESEMSWNITGKKSKNRIRNEVQNLFPSETYQLIINGKPINKLTADMYGMISFDCHSNDKIGLFADEHRIEK